MYNLIPIQYQKLRLGTLLINGTRLTEEDLILVEYSSTLINVELLRIHTVPKKLEAQQHKAVEQVIRSLMYQELEAIKHLINELKEMEGIVVVKKIAEANSLTPSVFINALRILQSAGIVQVRCHGAKGTYVKVLNQHLLTALEVAHV